jgi:hypothetical protein
LTRAYARACGGQRVAEAAPQGHWKILTILSALSLRGLLATMTIEEATDGDIFLAYVEQVLLSPVSPQTTLGPGSAIAESTIHID